jgi:arylformamidase
MKEMKVIDISWPISSATTGYKDRHVVNLEEVRTFAKDGARESHVRISAHTGTHVDAPSHFLKDGKTIDQIALERLIGPAKVIDLTDVAEKITRDRLADHDSEIEEGGKQQKREAAILKFLMIWALKYIKCQKLNFI